MKKVLVLLALVLGATNMFAFDVDGLFYNVTSEGDLTVEVIRMPNYGKYQGDVVIPETVRNNNKTYKVTAIGDQAFYNCLNLSSITIPKTIQSVGESVFVDCINLNSVTLYCKTVGRWFKGNSSIKKLLIGNGVQTIEKEAFSGCYGITSLSISNSVKSIGEYAFMDCNGLTSLVIPGSVKVIERGTFNHCLKLEKVVFSKGIVKISDYSFTDCRKLRYVTIPISVTSIAGNAFERTQLIEINIPSSMSTTVYRGAFLGLYDYIHKYESYEEQGKLSLDKADALPMEKVLFLKTEKDAGAGNIDAKMKLGDMYAKGIGTNKDIGLACAFFVEAAINGNIEAQKRVVGYEDEIMKNSFLSKKLLKLYPNIYLGYPDFSAICCKLVANTGNTDAQFEYGKMFLEGYGVETDINKAIEWIEKSANNGNNVEAMYMLGEIYLDEQYEICNHAKGAEWILKAAESGHELAKEKMAYLYLNGIGVKKNKKKAKMWTDK